MTTSERVLAEVSARFAIPSPSLDDELVALGFDSLGFLELFVLAEELAGRTLDERVIDELVTVGDVVTVVEREASA